MCDKIFAEPIELPCSNSICKSHLDDFKQDDCIFCHQSHVDIKVEEVALNVSLSETISSNLHLQEQEKELKFKIETLFNETRSVSEKLKNTEAETEKFCYEQFAKIMNSIDLQKEELKQKIDDIAENLINQVKEYKLKFEADFHAYVSKKQLSLEEVNKLEIDFNEALREFQISKEVLSVTRSDIQQNMTQLKMKLSNIECLRAKVSRCNMRIEEINLNSSVFGELKLSESVLLSSGYLPFMSHF